MDIGAFDAHKDRGVKDLSVRARGEKDRRCIIRNFPTDIDSNIAAFSASEAKDDRTFSYKIETFASVQEGQESIVKKIAEIKTYQERIIYHKNTDNAQDN